MPVRPVMYGGPERYAQHLAPACLKSITASTCFPLLPQQIIPLLQMVSAVAGRRQFITQRALDAPALGRANLLMAAWGLNAMVGFCLSMFLTSRVALGCIWRTCRLGIGVRCSR